MVETTTQALALLLTPAVAGMVLAAVPVGLVFGVLPGLGGLTALAMVLPFVYGMEPLPGLAFLLAVHAVVYTGGSVTAIVLGIPGAPPNAATVLDGYPLARRGRAGYAIGAALGASALGGLLGAAVLVLLLPVLRTAATAFGSPETFVLALLGVALVGALGGDRPVKGLIAGGLGIFLACFGTQRITGEPRFWLGSEYLIDGFRLVPLALGLFAVPEIVRMLATGAAVAAVPGDGAIDRREVLQGVLAVPRRWWLALRSAAIGTTVGIIPGVGGETAPFVAYLSARRAARDRDRFGRGAIEGVIAPESSNNAKEGGALVPTLALGIPGSSGMALLLGGFLVLGLDPGPDFLERHLDLALALALVVAAANVLGAALMLLVAHRVAVLTRVHGHVLGPPLLCLVVLGAYAAGASEIDVLHVFAFGALGYCMEALGFSRAALLLGFVLGGAVETYLHISLQAYGPAFLLRPLPLCVALVLLAGIAVSVRRRRGSP